jgi:hypothetical protein
LATTAAYAAKCESENVKMLQVGSTGEFKPYCKYNAKSGKWSRKVDGSEIDFESFTAIFDLENIKTGWFYVGAGVAPEKVFHKSLTEKVAKPEGTTTDASGKVSSKFKEGLQFDMYSTKDLGGVCEFFCTAQSVLRPLLELYNGKFSQERDANSGNVPVFSINGYTKETTKHGVNYVPKIEFLKWVARPDALKAGSTTSNDDVPFDVPVKQAAKAASTTSFESEF